MKMLPQASKCGLPYKPLRNLVEFRKNMMIKDTTPRPSALSMFKT
jgi:hypothetical protein